MQCRCEWLGLWSFQLKRLIRFFVWESTYQLDCQSCQSSSQKYSNPWVKYWNLGLTTWCWKARKIDQIFEGTPRVVSFMQFSLSIHSSESFDQWCFLQIEILVVNPELFTSGVNCLWQLWSSKGYLKDFFTNWELELHYYFTNR